MSSPVGAGKGTLRKIVAGWAHATHRLHECPPRQPSGDFAACMVKGYESGLIVRYDPRFVDIAASPVRLPAGFWRRAIWSEHHA
jgi:hypothetical protein